MPHIPSGVAGLLIEATLDRKKGRSRCLVRSVPNHESCARARQAAALGQATSTPPVGDVHRIKFPQYSRVVRKRHGCGSSSDAVIPTWADLAAVGGVFPCAS